MDVLVTIENRYDGTPDGKVWTPDQSSYEFFQRYLQVFDCVKVLARVNPVESVPDHYLRVDGERVEVIPVPYYVGMTAFAKRYFEISAAIKESITFEDVVILRLASPIATVAADYLQANHYPYAAEIISDPISTFAPGALQHPLRPLIRWWFVKNLRQQCQHATAAAYVTNSFLQQRYPCPNYEVGISDAELDDKMFVGQPHTYTEVKQPATITFVGSLAMMYKAPDVMLKAVRVCIDKGYEIKLKMLGDGKHRPEMEALSSELGLDEHVTFYGRLPGHHAVAAELDSSDLFVLPSRTEGQPRALLEAQARGLPCIGTTAGGMPELLPPEDIVIPGDVDTLANKIIEFISDPQRMTEAAARNLKTANEYRQDVLDAKRNAFYEYITQKTQAWLKR